MKMTPLLWRVVSVWLCVAVVCWYPSCYVGCRESHQEAQKPVSSQDISTEEESGEKTHHHKVEDSWVLPTQSPPENEQLIEDDQQKEEQTLQEVDKKEQYSEAFEADEPTVEVKLEAAKGLSQPEPEPEQGSENQNIEASITQDQESALLLPSSDSVSGSAAEFKDNTNIPDLQDNTPTSVSDDASDVAAPEIIASDLPPADCEEEEANPYDNDSPPIVLENTSNVHTAGTKTHTDPPLSSPAGHGTQHLEANTSHMLKQEQDLSSPVTTDTDSSVSSKDPEDIPTFDEWKRKMMEVEKEKTLSTHTSTNGGSHTVKKVQKNFNNYASVECGAKILGANPEAKSTSAILKENMDMYMLNPCSNKIWFIIELCEPIQLKQLDIANFELFSSTPKDFLVSISDRYPTNKWLKLGTFHARDERTVQSFPLDEHLYAKYVKMFTKYIKVELVSHFGSEHFCPLSLIRVFGTSMVEEYEEIADPSERPDDQDDDLDYPPGYAPGEVKYSKNLIGSAKDVILNMVNNLAVNVLGGGPEMQESEEVEISPDSDIPETAAPSSETSVPEPPTTDTSKQELPPVEEKIIIPLEKDEEESIGSTITLLDKEEEVDEGKEKKDPHERQEGLLPPSFSSSCSCAASLQEYLQRQCSVLLFKKCHRKDRKQKIPPIQTPTLHLPLSPSACPEPKQHHSEVHQPHDKEQASEQEPEKGASPSEAPPPPGNIVESHKESMSEPPLLEPSQTSTLPKPSVTDSSSAKPTPIVETPQLSSEEPAKQLRPEKSQEVVVEEKHMETSASLSSSSDVQPSISATVDESSVSDRQNYLVLSLVLCLCLGLLLFANRCRISTLPPTTEPKPPIPKSYSYCCPERQLSSCDDTGLKRSASYPLIHTESFQLVTTEGPEMLHAEETQSLFPANRKKRRRKMKPIEKVETLTPSFHAAPELCNGDVVCNGVPVTTKPRALTKRLLQPIFRDSPSEGSSEGSSHSDDPSFCGITTACTRICDGLPPPKTRSEKRALRRRRPKPSCAVVDLFQAPRRDKSESLPISTIQDIMNRKTEQSSGTFGVNVTLSGPV
eukprot:superscaffoldBa00002063_g13045